MPTIPGKFWNVPAETRKAVKAAIDRVEATGATASNPRVRAELKAAGASCGTSLLADLVRWHKRGLLPSDWSGSPEPDRAVGRPSKRETPAAPAGAQGDDREPDLLGQILAQLDQLFAAGIDTHDEHKRGVQLLGRALANGLSDKRTNAFRALLGEWRQNDKDQRDLPQEAAERILTASESGTTLLDAFERIVCDERRAEVLELAVAKLEEDLRELPSVDPLGRL